MNPTGRKTRKLAKAAEDTMPILENPQHEAFAQAVARGTDSTAAYSKIYPKAKHSSANPAGARLLAKVRPRVLEIQGKVEESNLLTIREKREFYALVLRTPIGDITETSVLCQSVKRTNSESGSSIEYKTIDKLKASQLDSELAGHVIQAEKQAINVNVGVAVSVVTEERRKQLMDRRRAVLSGKN